MQAVPNSLFSMPLHIGPSDVQDRIPRRLASEYEMMSARLGDAGEDFLLAAVERPSIASAKALVRAVAEVDSRKVAILSCQLDSGAMKAFAYGGIPYIRDEGNVFLPFAGMAASPVPARRIPGPLSPNAQRMVLNLISGRWDGLAAGELAKASGVSRATVTGCLAEIEAIAPSMVAVDWRRKILKNPGQSKEDLLETFEPYLVSPVKRRKFLKGRNGLAALRVCGVTLSGETALSYYTDLSHGSIIHVAVPRKGMPDIKEALGDMWVEAGWFEEPDIIVEEWAYVSDSTNTVSRASSGFDSIDALELYVEMKDVGDGDVRLSDAIAQLREVACR